MAIPARRKRKQDKEPQLSFWARHQLKMVKSAFVIFVCSLVAFFAYQLHVSYQDYINPEHVYGEWIEIGAPLIKPNALFLPPMGCIEIIV